jgi:hypothetical protein
VADPFEAFADDFVEALDCSLAWLCRVLWGTALGAFLIASTVTYILWSYFVG